MLSGPCFTAMPGVQSVSHNNWRAIHTGESARLGWYGVSALARNTRPRLATASPSAGRMDLQSYLLWDAQKACLDSHFVLYNRAQILMAFGYK